MALTENSLALSLTDAVALAQKQDPFHTASHWQETRLVAEQSVASTLPDPVVTMGYNNIPVDTFDFNQEPMTQIMVGIRQQMPRGSSLSLQQDKLGLMADNQPLLRADRNARVEKIVTELWLQLFEVQESIRLISADRGLFEYLVEVTQSRYASASAGTKQQDVIRAQLELTRLDERLSRLNEMERVTRVRLSEWIGSAANTIRITEPPTIQLRTEGGNASEQPLRIQLLDHPQVRLLDQAIKADEVDVELKKQLYKPGWGWMVNYGHRGEDLAGSDRADFLSVSLSFDVPLFTERRQDKQVDAAKAQAEARRSDRDLVIRGLLTELKSQSERIAELTKRQEIYESRLLDQMHQQAEASLNAYTHDDGDFAEVIRARIAELETRLQWLAIVVQKNTLITSLNYLTTPAEVMP